MVLSGMILSQTIWIRIQSAIGTLRFGKCKVIGGFPPREKRDHHMHGKKSPEMLGKFNNNIERKFKEVRLGVWTLSLSLNLSLNLNISLGLSLNISLSLGLNINLSLNISLSLGLSLNLNISLNINLNLRLSFFRRRFRFYFPSTLFVQDEFCSTCYCAIDDDFFPWREVPYIRKFTF
jgi:hypothetical protein